jgi:hypothetical protein
MKKVILVLHVFLLLSCAENQKQPDFLPTQTENTQAVIVKTSTPTIMIETQTPPMKSPTNTVGATSTPTLVVHEFPYWMKDPNTTIFTALIWDDSQRIYFFNAATSEKFEMDVPTDFSGFFWYDNMNFGILSEDLQTAYKYDLQSGQILTEIVPPQSTRFIANDRVNGLAISNQPKSNEIIFTDTRKTNMSLNKSYIAEWTDDDRIVSVSDTATGQIVWEHSLSKNRYGTELLWSPVNESHLAFLHGSPEPLNELITNDMTLTIVDISSGETLSTFDGDFGILRWSPDGKMILYLNPKFRYRNYGVTFRDAPCILFLATGEKKCLRSIPREIPTGYELLTTGLYEWASDSTSIFYTYLYTLPSEWDILGNLCNYSLIDSHIKCPTQNLEALKERGVISYDISPDEQYIHFCYSESTILNDYADTANDGVIKIDGSNFFSWAGIIQDQVPKQSCSRQTLWRPLP